MRVDFSENTALVVRETGSAKRLTLPEMHIFIDARRAAEIRLPVESPLRNIYLQWALRHPDVRFTWLLEAGEEIPDLPNLGSRTVAALAGSYSTLRRWYLRELPALWGSECPDLLIPVHGFAVPGLPVPQAVWLLQSPGRHFLEQSFFSRLQYRRNLPAMLKYARGGWLSGSAWPWAQRHLSGTDLSAWQVIKPVAVHDNLPGNYDSTRYDIDYLTGGRPFFASFISGAYPADTFTLMKSFSLFKKRQKTDWKLMLIGDRNVGYNEMKRAIAAYKYKDDVILLEATTLEKQAALEQAYALVQGVAQSPADQLMLAALEQSCAIIMAEKTPMLDWLGDAPLYSSGTDVTDVAECMMQVYKDEEVRQQLRQASAALYRRLTAEYQAEAAGIVVWGAALPGRM